MGFELGERCLFSKMNISISNTNKSMGTPGTVNQYAGFSLVSYSTNFCKRCYCRGLLQPMASAKNGRALEHSGSMPQFFFFF